MVHSIAVSSRHVFACQNSLLIQYDLNGTVVKQIEANLTKIIFNADFHYLIGHKNNTKQIVVYETTNLTIVSTKEFPKRPSAFTITESGDLVVSDKFGDVFRTRLVKEKDLQHVENSDADNPPELILGHVSMVLSLAVMPCHIASSDRDEHIRISRFPQSYVIENFLLGHQSYVSHIITYNEFLVSGGGDSYVLSWNWHTGEQLAKLDLNANQSVCGLVSNGEYVYILCERSSKVLKASLPDLDVLETIEFDDIVHCIAVNDKCYAGLASKVAGFNEIDGTPSEFISEDYLRKRSNSD